jgi:hypothetical protein
MAGKIVNALERREPRGVAATEPANCSVRLRPPNTGHNLPRQSLAALANITALFFLSISAILPRRFTPMPDRLRKIGQLRRLCNARRTLRSSADGIATHLQTLRQAAPLQRPPVAAHVSSFERK